MSWWDNPGFIVVTVILIVLAASIAIIRNAQGATTEVAEEDPTEDAFK